jgi:hypothetical protein
MRLAGRALLIVSLKLFSIMQSRYFSIFITLPSGIVLHKVVLGQSWFHACELLFYRDGFHRIQPDRSRYSPSR